MRTNKNPSSDFVSEDGINSLKPVVPPQFAYASRHRPLQVLSNLSSVTGTPVAAYTEKIPFGALLAKCIRIAFLLLSYTNRQLSLKRQKAPTCFRSSHLYYRLYTLFLKLSRAFINFLLYGKLLHFAVITK